MGNVKIAPHGDVACWSTDIAAGAGLHLPAGTYGGATYRSAMRFTAPSGWQNWTGITKATLTFYISDFNHVAPRNSSIYCRRQSTSILWDTLAEGTQNCESGFAGSNTTQYDDVQGTTTDQLSFTSGTTANAKKTLTVTAMVQYYWDNNVSRMVFVFERVGSSDYTELWSRNKSGYEAELSIDYEDNTPPTAPTLTAPASGATVNDTTPLLDWTHNDPQSNPQTEAQVRVWDAAGTTQVGTTQTVSGATSSLAWPNVLTRGTTYQFDVRTSDGLTGGGYGPWSSKRSFTILANPVVTVASTRVMVMSGGLPRLKVSWSHVGGAQTHYRVTAPGYDTGTIASTVQTLTLSGLALTNGTSVTVTVYVTTVDGLTDSDTQAFTPRWGQSVHRGDLGATPVNWGTPTISSTVPSGAVLTIEYGSAATAIAAPTGGWFASLAEVTKRRYVFYRVTLIPTATTSPSLNKISIPADFTIQVADHWYGPSWGALMAGWGIDTGEYVYGSRSMTAEGTGATTVALSEVIRLRAGRSYILTGLMKSQGNSGAVMSVYDTDGAIMVDINGVNVNTATLTATRDWFEPGQLDVYRYKTGVFVAPADVDVYVRLRINGAAGTQAWFDAVKLEESTVATPWSPAAVGAVSLDAGGVQVDANKGGVFRLRQASGAGVVELSTSGLYFTAAQLRIYDSEIRILGAGSSAILVDPDVSRTGNFLFQIAQANGTLSWGPGGGATRDTNLYRGGVSQLYTDDAFHAALWVNSGGGFTTGGRTEWVPGRVEGFIWDNLAGTQAITPMGRYTVAQVATYISRPISGRAGRVIGVVWRTTANITAGAITFTVLRHGATVTGGSATIDSASGTNGYAPLDTPFTFTAAQSLSVSIASVGLLPAGTLDFGVDIIVEWAAPTA